ncbi:MAG: prenyltransferase [Aeropyrum sp.]|nr:prenyltransferase [Aeropyrum sp.]
MGVLGEVWRAFRLCRVTRVEGAPRAALIVAATRLCVTPMTIYSVAIGGLLAWLEGFFDPLIFTLVLSGFIIAHTADNLLNDLMDYRGGLDRPGYLRVSYGVHPLLHGVLTPRGIALLLVLTALYNGVLALYLAMTKTPIVIVLTVLGALAMVLYSGFPIDAKRLGLGELLVALVWGPVMASGTYAALTGRLTLEALFAPVPYALTVSLVLVGKHLDKYDADRERGVKTLPVRLGMRRTQMLAAVVAAASPVLALLALQPYTPLPYALLLAGALPPALVASLAILQERPFTAPEGWRVWPLWHAAWAFLPMDALGRYTILALLSCGAPSPIITAAIALLAILMAAADLRSAIRLYKTYLKRGLPTSNKP